MKGALLLLALAACSSPHKATPDCAHTCDRLLDLAAAHLDETLAKISDHSDAETADHLRAQAADARAAERATCAERCEAGELDRGCVAAAADVVAAQACFQTKR
jgi:hypothetical protein